MRLRSRFANGSTLLVAALTLPFLVAACGYVPMVGGDGPTHSIHVPPTLNDTRWRGLEITFTRALRTDLRRTLNTRLDSTSPEFVLRTEIRQAERRLPVRSRDGGTLLGLSDLALFWSLERAQGDSLASGELTRSLEFLPSAGENPYFAFSEILDQMAETVALQVSETLLVSPNTL